MRNPCSLRRHFDSEVGRFIVELYEAEVSCSKYVQTVRLQELHTRQGKKPMSSENLYSPPSAVLEKVDSGATDLSNIPVSEKWRERFRLIERAGSVSV